MVEYKQTINADGRAVLGFPSAGHVEKLTNPKSRLWEAILCASETTGQRRSRLKKKLPSLRIQLLKELKPGGILENVPSWVRLRNEIKGYILDR